RVLVAGPRRGGPRLAPGGGRVPWHARAAVHELPLQPAGTARRALVDARLLDRPARGAPRQPALVLLRAAHRGLRPAAAGGHGARPVPSWPGPALADRAAAPRLGRGRLRHLQLRGRAHAVAGGARAAAVAPAGGLGGRALGRGAGRPRGAPPG